MSIEIVTNSATLRNRKQVSRAPSRKQSRFTQGTLVDYKPGWRFMLPQTQMKTARDAYHQVTLLCFCFSRFSDSTVLIVDARAPRQLCGRL